MLYTDAIIKVSHMYVVMYYLCIIYVSNIQTLHGQTYLTTYYVDNHKGLKLSHHVVEFGNVVFRFRFAEFGVVLSDVVELIELECVMTPNLV